MKNKGTTQFEYTRVTNTKVRNWTNVHPFVILNSDFNISKPDIELECCLWAGTTVTINKYLRATVWRQDTPLSLKRIEDLIPHFFMKSDECTRKQISVSPFKFQILRVVQLFHLIFTIDRQNGTPWPVRRLLILRALTTGPSSRCIVRIRNMMLLLNGGQKWRQPVSWTQNLECSFAEPPHKSLSMGCRRSVFVSGQYLQRYISSAG